MRHRHRLSRVRRRGLASTAHDPGLRPQRPVKAGSYPRLRPHTEFAKDKDGKVRDFVMIVDEQILNECQEARQLVFFVDVTIESRPMVVSNFSVPEASGNFCQRGGRFGSHSSNESMAPVFYKKIAFIAYFNAGVRAVDVRNPYQPKEIGYFIPPITEATDK